MIHITSTITVTHITIIQTLYSIYPYQYYPNNVNQFDEKWLTDKHSKIYHNNSAVGKISKDIIPIVYEKKLNLLNKIN